MLKIATIISVYKNDDPVLFDRALRSIIEQEFAYDLISRIYLGVDGPIPEDLEQVIESYKDHIFLCIKNKKNMGLARMLNRLISCLEDEDFVFRMDSDDYSLPYRYQEQLDHMQTFPHVDVLGTDIIECQEGGGKRRLVQFCPSGMDAQLYICYGVPVAHPTVCFRKNVFSKAGLYPNVRGNEDVAFWFKCLDSGLCFDNVHMPLVEFSVSESFWGRRGYGKAFTELMTYLNGIYNLHGITWRMIYPVARFFLRLSPAFFTKLCYSARAKRAID